MLHTILRLPATKSQSGYSRSTIYLRITQGLWIKQISLGPRAIGWPAAEVAALTRIFHAPPRDRRIAAELGAARA